MLYGVPTTKPKLLAPVLPLPFTINQYYQEHKLRICYYNKTQMDIFEPSYNGECMGLSCEHDRALEVSLIWKVTFCL